MTLAGFRIRLAGDWTEFAKTLQGLARVNFTALHKILGEEVLAQVARRFRTGTDPEGKPWPRSYRARLGGGQTLRDTSRLQRSFTYRADPRGVAVGTNDIRARVHQFGGTIRPKRSAYLTFRLADGRWARVKVVHMPARPMLGFADRDLRDLEEVIKDYFEGLIKR